MQTFNEHSPTTDAILRDERFLRLGAIPGDGHVPTGLEGNPIEALVKPIGVVQGISDVPWHKDCSLGRHSYECCSMTVGISVTGADAVSGQLRVVAGSHRTLIWPALQQPGRDLPEVDLPTRTGDVTIHLSCTLHMSQPPRERERRVMYTSFRLPVLASKSTAEARARLRAVREAAHTTVSQEPASQAKHEGA
jgi:ectoine hydroxylase-related dioxygenase (phytanoyl-CoA dioxygenase family)